MLKNIKRQLTYVEKILYAELASYYANFSHRILM